MRIIYILFVLLLFNYLYSCQEEIDNVLNCDGACCRNNTEFGDFGCTIMSSANGESDMCAGLDDYHRWFPGQTCQDIGCGAYSGADNPCEVFIEDECFDGEDECGVCGGDGSSCTNEFECLSDCPNYDEVYEDIQWGNDCLVCGEFIDFVLFDDCSEDCDSELLYWLWAECDVECNVWDNQSDCQGSSCIWDDSNLQCVDWPYYTECAEIYDEAYNLGFDIGAMSGDSNLDGSLDVLDIVYFVDVILNP